ISVLSVIVLILIALSTLVAVNRARFYYLLRRIRKENPNDAVLTAYEYILRLFKVQNVTISAGETPSQFGARVEKLMDFKGYTFNKSDFNKITEYYVKARYSRNLLPEKVNQELIDFIDTVLRLTSEKVSKVKFNLYKYLLGKL
ncbi:MAG TPA: transglutaminase domain-containing protein, partial [Ruminiclostridium sp.]|nr:transglutaminase domain-containing protein [Ruminiclostridium sp.]